jgi:hypothetical protein
MQNQIAASLAADNDFFDWDDLGENRFFLAPELGVAGGWPLRVPAPRGLPQRILPLTDAPRSAS